MSRICQPLQPLVVKHRVREAQHLPLLCFLMREGLGSRVKVSCFLGQVHHMMYTLQAVYYSNNSGHNAGWAKPQNTWELPKHRKQRLGRQPPSAASADEETSTDVSLRILIRI